MATLNSLHHLDTGAGNAVIYQPARPLEQNFSEYRHLVCLGHWYAPHISNSTAQWLLVGLRSKIELLTVTCETGNLVHASSLTSS